MLDYFSILDPKQIVEHITASNMNFL